MTARADGTAGTLDLVADGTSLDDGQTTQTAEEREATAAKIADSSFFDGNDDAAAEDSDDQQVTTEDQDAAAKAAADKVDADKDDTDDAEDADAKDDAKDDADNDGDQQAAEDDGESESTPVGVPAAMRRSLKAAQWTDAEIDGHYIADPELAMKTFNRVHTQRMDILGEYARIGRGQAANAATATDSRTASEAVTDQPIQAIDVAALTAEMGEEHSEIAQRIAAPINAVVAKIQAVMPTIERGAAAAEHAEKVQALSVINTFFGSDGLKPYVPFYGDSTKGRTKAENQRYDQVLELADAMISGAAYQGRELRPEDALEAAHHDVSSEFQVQAVRTKLKQTVRKKAASVSLKPTGRGKSTATQGRAKNESDRVAKATAGLKAVFG